MLKASIQSIVWSAVGTETILSCSLLNAVHSMVMMLACVFVFVGVKSCPFCIRQCWWHAMVNQWITLFWAKLNHSSKKKKQPSVHFKKWVWSEDMRLDCLNTGCFGIVSRWLWEHYMVITVYSRLYIWSQGVVSGCVLGVQWSQREKTI